MVASKLTTQKLLTVSRQVSESHRTVCQMWLCRTLEEVNRYLDEMKCEYEALIRKQLLKEEQQRIKERIREEQKVEQEYEREMKRLEMERQLAETLIEEARARVDAENSARIAELERRLQEAESNQRALSMAQQTKAGNVY